MRYKVERVRGAQADGAERIGLVKINRKSAEALYSIGVPLVIAGSKVSPFHFFGGWHLAFDVDSDRWLSEGKSFRSMAGGWSSYNEHPETGKAAFFVDRKYVAAESPRRRRR